ncbi:MAG: BON domain-containing protein [Chloroflexi bacterium]|mgnify:CR=1 FL=1|jgi:osmotically-inducible protein OsmY|nr:BON domain-containing protein [Chloroflexota bacterium]
MYNNRKYNRRPTVAARYRRGESRYHYSGYGPYSGKVRRADGEIEADIVESLVRDTWANADRINVEVRDGRVTLTGEVASAVEKRAAGDDAWDTLGVVDVDNDLKISSLK